MTNNKKTLYVQGMHCAACEVLIEKEFKTLNGITDAKANLNQKTVSYRTNGDTQLNLKELNKKFRDMGYSFTSEEVTSANTGNNIGLAIIITLSIIGIFYLFERSGLIKSVSLSSESGFAGYFLFGLVAGVSSCAALVGGLLLSLSKQWSSLYSNDADTIERSTPYVLFNTGRLVSFFIFGALLGLLGSAFKTSLETSAFITIVVGILMVFLGLQMLGVGFGSVSIKTPKFVSSYIVNEKNFKGRYMPLLVGVLTFFVPCGFTLIAQANVLTQGNPIKGAFLLLAFALGTLPMLLFISFSGSKFQHNKKFSGIFNYVSGFLVLFFAIYTINSQLNLLGFKSLSDLFTVTGTNESSAVLANNDNIQNIKITAKGFQYFPSYIKLKSGVPTRLEVESAGVIGCASVMSGRGLFPGYLQLREGVVTTEFTPKPGTYKITCSMGMVSPITVDVE